jgi:hypothetical protein
VQLDAEARAGGDERPPGAVLLHARWSWSARAIVAAKSSSSRTSPSDHARNLPLAGLDDDVDGALLQLREPVLEADAVELLPRDARLVAAVLVFDAPVARDEAEPELGQVPGLDLAHPARHEVVVEEVHPGGDSRLGGDGHWTLDPLQLAPPVVLAIAYAMRVRTLRAEARRRRWWRIVLLRARDTGPARRRRLADRLLREERSQGFHMAQHLLIGDLAPLGALAGVTGPIPPAAPRVRASAAPDLPPVSRRSRCGRSTSASGTSRSSTTRR